MCDSCVVWNYKDGRSERQTLPFAPAFISLDGRDLTWDKNSVFSGWDFETPSAPYRLFFETGAKVILVGKTGFFTDFPYGEFGVH